MSATLAAYRMAWADLQESPRLYFWTATFAKAIPVWRVNPAWHWAWRGLTDFYGSIRGIRVAEWHEEHGIHFHFVIDQRLAIEVVRKIFQRFDFGRINVQLVRNPKGTARYLEGYLNKGEKLGFGLRRFTRLGKIGVPKNDLVCKSELAELCRLRVRQAKEYHRGELNQAQRFKVIKAAQREYDASFFVEPIDPAAFALHNDPEIDLTHPAPSKLTRVKTRWNRWS